LELADRRVLDFCCGDGEFSFMLAARDADVHGIDISPELIRLAETSVPANIRRPTFSVRDGHATGFPDNSFDYVFGNCVLHHLQLDLAYAEIYRVLKPGGRAFFMEPLKGNPLMRMLRAATPSAHTKDERPMCFADIDRAKTHFSRVTHTEHFCIALLAAPLHLLSGSAANRVIHGLDRIDRG
jgi:ubiquinone/menaquinone biosynthesis C-methylase UbiE